MQPHHVARQEFEYIRHGTSSLIASRHIVTGQVEAACDPTHPHGQRRCRTHCSGRRPDPGDPHIFVMDNLNTHQSETLVRFVIRHDPLAITPEELGVKGTSGILDNHKNAESLSGRCSSHHPIDLHAQTLLIVESDRMGLSIIVRRLLNKRSSFPSVAAMKERIQRFINDDNEHLVKPFKWTVEVKLLKI